MSIFYRFLFIFAIVICFLAPSVFAQSGYQISKQINSPNGNPIFMQFDKKAKKISIQEGGNLLEQSLGFSKQDKLTLIGSESEALSRSAFTHQKYQQYHAGIKVEYGVYKVHARNGIIESASGESYKIPDISPVPTLSEEKALSQALHFVGAKRYKWQLSNEKDTEASLPKAELVFCKDFFAYHLKGITRFALAYKFDIYAHEPLSRAYVYVDANTGKIIHHNAIIKHADGTASTRYNGSQKIITEQSNGMYILRDATRGKGIETYNANQSYSYNSATDFTDKDNNWTSAEHANTNKDNAALDAHWGAMKTYDYFLTTHKRNSFDGFGATIKSYVHYGIAMDNAFWDGEKMSYGDGDERFDALTSLDIVAHELGHAVCQYTADLVYSYESGALNEGLSDIWGASVEYKNMPNKSTWLLGEDAGINNVPLRSMSNPNAFEQPDTYLGTFWYLGENDQGGVHTNSGVLNHWFYLLSEGKNGINDHGFLYNVNGIGIEKAAQIIYHTENAYLSANSQYSDARAFSIQAAIDLFGAGSKEAIQTVNAWNAVGVYAYLAAPTTLTATVNSATQVTLQWKDQTTTETGFRLERSLQPKSGFIFVADINANTTSYVDKGLATDKIYFYRVLTLKGKERSVYSNEANAILGNAPIIMSNASFITCKAVFLDPGGTDYYEEEASTTTTFSPATPGAKITVNFTSFSTFDYYDVLSIYDGGTTNARLIGSYSGTSLPPTATATNATGQLTFKFYSYIGGSGWQATISCLSIPTTPTTLTANALSSNEIKLDWKHNATNETTCRIYRSTTTGSGFTQIGEVAGNVLTFSDKNLQASTTYYYKVLASNAMGNSGFSNEANATTASNLPATPSTLSAVAASKTQINLKWTDNASNEQKFEVYQAATSGGTFTKIGETLANVAIFLANNLTPGTTYYYKVKAINAAGSSGFSNEANATTLANPPVAPSNLVATAAPQLRINLSWKDNATNEQKVEVYRSLTASSGFVKIGETTTNATSYSDQNLLASTKYYYRVQAVNSGGTSGFSNEVSATTLQAPPFAPYSLTISLVSQSQLTLNWKDNANNEQSIEVYRSLTTGSGFVKIADLAANTITYVNTGLAVNSTYFYKVRAGNAGGFSEFSNEVKGTTLPTVPLPPTTLSATAISQSQINLSWLDKATNETKFEIYRSLKSGSDFILLAEVATNSTVYSDKSALVATKYYYKVRATNAGGSSGFSNEVSATTLPAIPATPTTLTAIVVSQTQVNLSWKDNSTNEQKFEIHRSASSGSGFTKIAEVAANITTFANTGLTVNSRYFYKVLAVNTGVKSAFSNEVSATTLPDAPTAPTSLSAATLSQTQLNLTWQDKSTNETGFKIERAMPNSSVFTEIAVVGSNVTTYASTGLAANTKYAYRIKAYNAGGYSAYSNEASATTLPLIPSAPTNLSAKLQSVFVTNITWKDNSDNEGLFIIERSTNESKGFVAIDSLAANTASYTDSHISVGVSYFYRVVAINTGGKSAYSNVSGIALITSLEDEVIEKGTLVYPNPSPDGHFSVSIHSIPSETIQVKVMNAQGQYVIEQSLSKTPGKYTFAVDLSAHPAGEYLLQISMSKGKAAKRLIKQ